MHRRGWAAPCRLVRRLPAVDPSFGCPALWIAPQERDNAIAEGFLAVDPSTVIATHLNHQLLRQPADRRCWDQRRCGQVLDAVRE